MNCKRSALSRKFQFSDNADTYDTCNNNHKLSSKYRLVIILPLYSSPLSIISVKTINTKLITDNYIFRPIDLTIAHRCNPYPFTLSIIANGCSVNVRWHAPQLHVQHDHNLLTPRALFVMAIVHCLIKTSNLKLVMIVNQ